MKGASQVPRMVSADMRHETHLTTPHPTPYSRFFYLPEIHKAFKLSFRISLSSELCTNISSTNKLQGCPQVAPLPA